MTTGDERSPRFSPPPVAQERRLDFVGGTWNGNVSEPGLRVRLRTPGMLSLLTLLNLPLGLPRMSVIARMKDQRMNGMVLPLASPRSVTLCSGLRGLLA